MKDGLNLNPFEYIACKVRVQEGLTIISEFTGASRVLAGSLAINPWNTSGPGVYLLMSFRFICKLTLIWGLGSYSSIERF